jgi:hypothetical protein
VTPLLFPAATAKAATTPKACETCGGQGHFTQDVEDFACSDCEATGEGESVSWLVLPAGASVQPGDRITITATCETVRPICNRIGMDFGRPDHRCCPDCVSGVVTYGTATIARVLPVVGWRDADNDVGREVNYEGRWMHPTSEEAAAWLDAHVERVKVVDPKIGYVEHQGVDGEKGVLRNISDQFPDGPPQPGDTCIRITDVEVTG